jgi:hypothetical protein
MQVVHQRFPRSRFSERPGFHVKDLCDIIRTYYNPPQFYGSFSLKSVLLALLPQMSYKHLAIQEGS